jgi:hypothetical protein
LRAPALLRWTTNLPAQEIGRIWQADYDIDIAGKLLDGSMLYGECKWWRDLVGENVLDELIQRASRTDYGHDNPKRQFVLYARTGFTTALHRRGLSAWDRPAYTSNNAAARENADTPAETSGALAPMMASGIPRINVSHVVPGQVDVAPTAPFRRTHLGARPVTRLNAWLKALSLA